MNIFSNFTSFLKRHSRKFLISGLIVGGSCAAYYFANYKLKELQEREIQDMLEGVRRQRYFENIIETCDETILSLDKTLRKSLDELTNVQHLIDTLKTSPTNKVEIWQELKVATFTHLILLIYTESLLVTILRIQLGIIGGFMYKEKVREQNRVILTTQEKYLSLFVHFTKTGLKDLYDLIRDKVTVILSGIQLSDTLNVQKMKEIFWSMQTLILNEEDALMSHLESSLRNNNGLADENSDPLLKELYSDTLDVLCSADITKELCAIVSFGFIHFSDQIVQLTSNGYSYASKKASVPLARLIPIISNVTHNKQHCDISSSWLQQLLSTEKFKLLCANVYEAYC